jgi:hypothetical protein
MNEKRVGFLHDADGGRSSKRLSSMLCLVTAISLAVYGGVSGTDTTALVIAMLSASGAYQGLTILQGK